MAPVITQATGLAADLNMKIDDYTGPVSYLTGGMTVGASVFGLPSGLYFVKFMDLSVSGTYRVQIRSISGPRAKSVLVKWIVNATGLEVGNGTNLSAEKFRFLAFGV